MEKEDNCTAASAMALGLVDMDYSFAPQHQHDHYGSGSMDRAPFTGFGDVMQFADFGPRLALENHSHIHENEDGDGNYMLKFPVLNEHHDEGMIRYDDVPGALGETSQGIKDGHEYYHDQSHEGNEGNEVVVQLEFLGASGGLNQMMMTSSDQVMIVKPNNNNKGKSSNNNSKRKRARSVKTTQEVESQRMTHIAVERNRRKQMNEHLRILRTLMPSSYVQRGDQASIIGGAIEFVRELEQLLQCLESQKRRRLYGEGGPSGGGGVVPLPSNQPFVPSNDPSNENEDQEAMAANKLVDLDNTMMMSNLGGLQEETAERKSSIADVEVKLLGFDAFIKILSRRRPGQLIKAISALQDLQFNILHTNITTIEQTVLYSFNVQISSDTRFSAEDIASSVQQIFAFINASTAM